MIYVRNFKCKKCGKEQESTVYTDKCEPVGGFWIEGKDFCLNCIRELFEKFDIGLLEVKEKE